MSSPSYSMTSLTKATHLLALRYSIPIQGKIRFDSIRITLKSRFFDSIRFHNLIKKNGRLYIDRHIIIIYDYFYSMDNCFFVMF